VANITQPILKDISNTLPAGTDAALASATTPDVTTSAINNATVALQPGETATSRSRFSEQGDTVKFNPNKSLAGARGARREHEQSAKKAPFAIRLTITSNNNFPAAVANSRTPLTQGSRRRGRSPGPSRAAPPDRVTLNDRRA
jgi:hypothetical protein